MGRLTDDDVTDALRSRPGWERDGEAIVRELKASDFKAAITFVNAVAEIAEERDHHPDLLIHGYNKVRVTISTHSEGGLTGLDFALAEAIDGVDVG